MLKALRLTGTRPSEVCEITDIGARGDAWMLAEHKEDAAGEARVVDLNDEMRAITARRIEIHPEGPRG